MTMDNKWTLEDHFSTSENNKHWDSAGEAARNGKTLTDYVEAHLLDVEDRVRLMDASGIERSIVSLTSPGIQSLTDVRTAIELARKTNDLVREQYVDNYPDRLSMFACIPTQDPTRPPLSSSGLCVSWARWG